MRTCNICNFAFIIFTLFCATPAQAKFTPRQVVLIRRIQDNVKQLKIELRESNDSNEVTRVELGHSQEMVKAVQSKIDGKNAQITSIAKKLAHYEFAWSVIAVIVAALAAFLVFRLVGLVLPWGLVAVGASFAATYAAVFSLPNFL